MVYLIVMDSSGYGLRSRLRPKYRDLEGAQRDNYLLLN